MYVPRVSMTQSDQEIGEQLVRGFEETGFAVLIDHPVNASIIRTAYIAAEQLFRRPKEQLMRYAAPNEFFQVGYGPFGCEKAKDQKVGDLKEFWHARRDVGPDHPSRRMEGFVDNIWPDDLEPGFRRASLNLYYALEELAGHVLRLTGRALGLPNDELSDMIVNGKSLLRILHYPAREDVTEGVRSAAHEDINLITLLVAATSSGLEVKAKNGDWIAVNETPGSIVVNVGDMLQLYTGGRLKSTTHRVANPEGKAWTERYSAPLFLHPRGEVVLDQETGYTAAQYLRKRLDEIVVTK